MLHQIILGSTLMLASVVIAGLSFWFMEVALVRFRGFLAQAPHRPRLILMLCVISLWILAQITAGVWLWAVTFYGLGAFATLEESLYFAIVTYTTLGFGDVLLAQDWRILSGMAAANGLLNIGLLTAVLVEALAQVRRIQTEAIRESAGGRE